MGKKATYEELEQKVKELEKEAVERKQAKDALRVSEERLNLAQNIAKIGYWSWDIASGRVEWSDQVYKIFKALQKKPSYEFAKSFVHPDDLNLWQNTIQQAVEKQKPFTLDYRAIRSDGKTIWVHNETKTVFNERGDFTGYQGTVQDITERKRTEDAWRKQNELLSTILDNIPVMIAFLNANAEHKYVNRCWKQKLGWSLTEVQKRDVLADFYPDPEYRRYVKDFIRDSASTWGDFKTCRRDGMVLDTMWANVPLSDGSNIGIGQDITERKQVEEALLKSEEYYRSLVENQTDLVCRFIPDGTLVFVNDAFCHFFKKTKVELIGKKWQPLPVDDDVTFIQEKLLTLSPSNKTVLIENRVFSGKGDIHWIQFINSGFFDHHGNLLETQSVGRDITTRKQTEERLYESESRLRTIFDASKAGIILVDSKGVITFANQGMADMFGCSLQDLIGSNYPEHVHPDQQDIGDQRMRQLIAGEIDHVALERHYIRLDGTNFWGFLSGRRHEDEHGNLISLVGIIADITELKQAEETLRQSEEIHRTVTNSVWDSIVIVQDAKVMWANNVALEKMGYSEDEFIGLYFQKIIHPDDLPSAIQRSQDRISGKPVEDPTYMKIITKDGKVLEAENRGAVITWSGKPASVQTLRDITEEKRKEKAQKKLEDQLRQAQKMESIGTLVGGIAHDFNNILGIILGNMELAMDDIPEWNPARLNLKEVRTASLRAKDVVRQLLSFARKTKLEKKPINIIPIIKEALKLMRSSIPTSIEIRQHIKEDIGTILADPTQINQILINLCTNANHAMPDGGIIEVTLKNVVVNEDTDIQYPELHLGRYVNLNVSDTGHGISKQEIDRIFEPYFTTKEVGKGTGMGLAVVHGIVKGHNGSIAVESELGKGTTFSIFFPAVEKEAFVETETDDKLPTGDERVLFIDDEELLVNLGRQRLERLGYQIEATTSPIKALDLFRSKPDQFDLVITDLTMPKMTGDKLVKEILNIRPEIPIILCTGFSEKIDERKAKEIGAADYIEKPNDQRDFAFKVRKVLDGK